MLQPTTGTSDAAPLVSRAPAAPVPDVPRIRAGSYYDAKILRAKIQGLLSGLDRAGDRLASLLELAQERRIFMVLAAPDGAVFPDWTAFATTRCPWGLGLPPALVATLAEEQRDPHRRARLALQSAVVLGRRGRQAGPAPAVRLTANDRGTAYKLARLKRDHPELLERLARGELPSIAAAWEAAGLDLPRLHLVVAPMPLARVVVTRLDGEQQRELVDLLTHPEKITAPPHGRASAAWKAFEDARTTPEQRAQQEAERAARRVAACSALEARHREQYAAARRSGASRTEARVLGRSSLAGDAVARGDSAADRMHAADKETR